MISDFPSRSEWIRYESRLRRTPANRKLVCGEIFFAILSRLAPPDHVMYLKFIAPTTVLAFPTIPLLLAPWRCPAFCSFRFVADIGQPLLLFPFSIRSRGKQSGAGRTEPRQPPPLSFPQPSGRVLMQEARD
jgi:hypothetical protein